MIRGEQLAIGAPEEHVLEGMFERVFAQGCVRFDVRRGDPDPTSKDGKNSIVPVEVLPRESGHEWLLTSGSDQLRCSSLFDPAQKLRSSVNVSPARGPAR